MGKNSKVARFIIFIIAMVSFILSAIPASAANSCHGDYCSGKDPSSTGTDGVPCANDGRTVASTAVDVRTWWGSYVDVGILEVRWSPRCQANWARLSLNRDAGDYKGIYLTQDSGYQLHKFTAGNWPGSSPGVYWTPMIYSPISRVYAHIDRVWEWTCNKCATGWV